MKPRKNALQISFALTVWTMAGTSLMAQANAAATCANTVYLTVNPGRMEFAPRIADVLRRQQVPAGFFVSNLATKSGGDALGDQWGTWWKVIAGQGHEFVSQTYDYVEWRADNPGYRPEFRMRPAAGAFEGREFTFDPPKYCEQISHAAQRIEFFTGKKALPLFHAPTGKTSPKLLAAASACGFAHVGATPGGLLASGAAGKGVAGQFRNGDILLADLGASASTEPWAVSNLEPLIADLKARGTCFGSLRNHPAFKDWIASHGG